MPTGAHGRQHIPQRLLHVRSHGKPFLRQVLVQVSLLLVHIQYRQYPRSYRLSSKKAFVARKRAREILNHEQLQLFLQIERPQIIRNEKNCSFSAAEFNFTSLLYCSDPEKDKIPSSFFLIRVSSTPPCMVLRFAFMVGTPGYVRNKVKCQLG